MSVTFRNCPDESLTEKFVAEADQQGLHAMKGHRSVGGLRASIYNAMPVEGVEQLRIHGGIPEAVPGVVGSLTTNCAN